MADTINTLLLMLTVSTAMPAFALDKPEWTSRKPADDAGYKYYVGRSSQSASESASFTEANLDAIYQAIRDNFGFVSQVSVESYETENRSALFEKVKELSKRIKFLGFEQVDSVTETTASNRHNTWILFRYKKSEIVKERTRLTTAKGISTVKPEYSTVGDLSDAEKGVLEVTSEPPGAVVYVDGNRWGETPIRILGKLSPGKHPVRLEHKDYEVAEEEIVYRQNVQNSFNRILMKGSGYVKIVTIPSNATVFVNGEYIGASPTEFIKLATVEQHTLKITHSEAEVFTQGFSVQQDEQRVLTVTLPLKQSTLTVSSKPSDATITVNGLKAKSGETLYLPPGEYVVEVKKDLFVSESRTVSLRGGQKLVMPTVILTPYSKALIDGKYIQSNPFSISPGFGFWSLRVHKDVEMKGGSFGILGVEKQFRNLFGVRLAYVPINDRLIIKEPLEYAYYDGSGQKDEFSELDVGSISGSLIQIGLPIYVTELDGNARTGWYLMPYYLRLNGKYQITDQRSVPTVESKGSMSSNGGGIEGGYYVQYGPVNLRVGASAGSFAGSVPHNEIAPRSLWTLSLEIGWVVGGTKALGLADMESKVNSQ
jgi:hypothetical protein